MAWVSNFILPFYVDVLIIHALITIMGELVSVSCPPLLTWINFGPTRDK